MSPSSAPRICTDSEKLTVAVLPRNSEIRKSMACISEPQQEPVDFPAALIFSDVNSKFLGSLHINHHETTPKSPISIEKKS